MTGPKLSFAPDDPRAADVRALLERHLAFAREVTPPGHVHALDAEGLLDPAVTFFSARASDGSGVLVGTLLGVVALRQIDALHAEVKSMHVAESARGTGLGRAILDEVLAVARDRGCTRVSLETGTMPAFAAARALYESAGFTVCPPFGSYTANPNSTCMTLTL